MCYFRTMASIKEAVQSAMAFAKDTLDPARASGLQLEEVQSGVADGKDVWLITLSVANPVKFSALNLSLDSRDYKIFAVLKSSGEVTSMKIRELATT